jgi:putative solute:sodium symporter small subunit
MSLELRAARSLIKWRVEAAFRALSFGAETDPTLTLRQANVSLQRLTRVYLCMAFPYERACQARADNGWMSLSQVARRRLWSQTVCLTLTLLGLWLLINFAVPWFARHLDPVRGFGFSAGYWLAAEGALLMYLAIIVIYVWRMDVLERRYLSELPSDDFKASGPPDAERLIA